MAAEERLLVGRLRDDQLVFRVGPQVFTPIVAQHLDVWATPADGFEAMHAAVMHELPTDEAVGHELDTHLAAADFQDGHLRAAEIVPLGHDIEAFNATADKAAGAVNHTLTEEPTGLSPGQLSAGILCPAGSTYDPFWKILGYKYPCVGKDGPVPPTK